MGLLSSIELLCYYIEKLWAMQTVQMEHEISVLQVKEHKNQLIMHYKEWLIFR